MMINYICTIFQILVRCAITKVQEILTIYCLQSFRIKKLDIIMSLRNLACFFEL